LHGTGFKAKVALVDGVRRTYEWYEQNWETARK